MNARAKGAAAAVPPGGDGSRGAGAAAPRGAAGPAIGFATITDVEMAADLRSAKCSSRSRRRRSVRTTVTALNHARASSGRSSDDCAFGTPGPPFRRGPHDRARARINELLRKLRTRRDAVSEPLDASYRAVAELLEAAGASCHGTGTRTATRWAPLSVSLSPRGARKEARVVMRDGCRPLTPGCRHRTGRRGRRASVGLAGGWTADRHGVPSATGPADEPGEGALRTWTPPRNTCGHRESRRPPAAAVGEIVADLLDLLGWPLTPEIATNLWSRSSRTRGRSIRKHDAESARPRRRLVAAVPRRHRERVPLRGAAALHAPPRSARPRTLGLHAGGRVATVELPKRFSRRAARGTRTRGLVNRARSIDVSSRPR